MKTQLTKETVVDRIKQVFAKEFKISPGSLKPDVNLYADLGLDSIDAIDLVVRLEVETGIKLNAVDLKSIRTFKQVVDIVFQKLKEKG